MFGISDRGYRWRKRCDGCSLAMVPSYSRLLLCRDCRRHLS